MAASVATTGAAIFRTGASPAAGPNLAGNWAYSGWHRIDSYTGGAGAATIYTLSLNSGTAACTIQTAATGKLQVIWASGGGITQDTTVFTTGSATAWIYIGLSHVSSANTIQVYWRFEGDSTFHTSTLSATALTVGPGSFAGTENNILWDGAAASAHVRAIKIWSASRTSAQLLTESTLLNTISDATSIFSFLDLDTTTNATVDGSGAGNNYSLFSTITNSAVEPNAGISATPATGAQPPRLVPVPGTLNLLSPPFWPPARELGLSTVNPPVPPAPPPLPVGLLPPSPPLFGEFNRFVPPFWPPARELALSTISQPPSGFAASGLAVLSSIGVATVGVLTFAAAGSAGLSSVSAAGSGIEAFAGTGSAACQPLTASGAGVESFDGSAITACSSLSSNGIGAETVSCTGSAALSTLGVTANGVFGNNFSGSASTTISSIATSAVGVETFFGSAGISCSSLGVVGSGLVSGAVTGAGSAVLSILSVLGTGFNRLAITGSGSAMCSSLGVLGVCTNGTATPLVSVSYTFDVLPDDYAFEIQFDELERIS